MRPHFRLGAKLAGCWRTEVKLSDDTALGLDTASIDYGQSTEFASHVALMTNDIPAFENVANLDKLPTEGFHVFAFADEDQGRQRRAA